MAAKPSIAVFKFSSCDGCQLSLLNMEDDLLAITNFGAKSLEEVIQKLDERGLSLRVKE